MVTEGPAVGVAVRGVTERADTEGEDSGTRRVVKMPSLENSNLNSVVDSVVDVVLLRDSKISRKCFFSPFRCYFFFFLTLAGLLVCHEN